MDNNINKSALQNSINDTLQRSFNMSLFNDSFDKLNKIAEINQDNPAQLEIEADAYIDGTLSGIDADTKEVEDVLKTQKNGLVDQAYRRFTANQVTNADKEIAENLYKSGEIALDSYKKKLPEKIQVLESANYIKNINDSLAAGRITPSQAVELYENFSRDIIINNLGDILRDKSVSVEEKQEWIYKMIDGKTGEKSVDEASPYVRLKAVQAALTGNKQLQEYDDYIKNNARVSDKNLWDERYLAAANYAANNGDAQTLLDMMSYLKSTAQNKQDFDNVDDIYKYLDRKTDIRAKMSIQNSLNSGELNKQEKLDLVNNNQQFFSLEDMNSFMEQINDPVERLMETSRIKTALANARAAYGWNPAGPNNAYDAFYASLRANLEEAHTNKEIQDAINKAKSDTDSLYGDITSYGRFERTKSFINEYKKYEIKPEDIDIMINKRLRELDKKAPIDSNLRQQLMPQAEADVVNELVRQKGLTYDEATVMLQEAKRINAGGM